MLFEVDMINELEQIQEIGGKVSALIADEGVTKPFLVCNKELVTFTRVLQGHSVNTKAIYMIHILGNTYLEAQQIQDKVKDKLLSFQQRPIGTNGTVVQSAVVEYLEDKYEYQPEVYHSFVRLTVII